MTLYICIYIYAMIIEHLDELCLRPHCDITVNYSGGGYPELFWLVIYEKTQSDVQLMCLFTFFGRAAGCIRFAVVIACPDVCHGESTFLNRSGGLCHWLCHSINMCIKYAYVHIYIYTVIFIQCNTCIHICIYIYIYIYTLAIYVHYAY